MPKNDIFSKVFLNGPAPNREFPKWASPNQEFLKWASPYWEFLKWASPNREFPKWASPIQDFKADPFQEFGKIVLHLLSIEISGSFWDGM